MPGHLTGPKWSHKCTYKRKAERDLMQKRRQLEHQGRGWSDAVTVKERQQPLDT